MQRLLSTKWKCMPDVPTHDAAVLLFLLLFLLVLLFVSRVSLQLLTVYHGYYVTANADSLYAAAAAAAADPSEQFDASLAAVVAGHNATAILLQTVATT